MASIAAHAAMEKTRFVSLSHQYFPSFAMTTSQSDPAVPNHRKPKSKEIETYLKWLLDSHDFLEQMDVLRSIGLLEGLQEAAHMKFFERLMEKPVEKKALGEFLAKAHIGPEIEAQLGDNQFVAPRFFFESGSTLAYVIGESARQIRGKLPRKDRGLARTLEGQFLSNNFFGMTGFSGLVKHVEPTIGAFDPHYYGLFPFRDRAPEPDDRLSRESECAGFESLRDAISQCHKVFTTCSNFSFLTGPLVGGRSNALTKRALAEGLIRAGHKCKYHLAFHFEKIVLLSPENSEAPFSMRSAIKNKCLSVFPLVSDDELSKAHAVWNQELANWRNRKQLSDSSPLNKLEWHAGVLHEKAIPTAINSLVESFVAVRGDNLYRKGLTTYSWTDIAPHVTLVISLPDQALDRAVAVLREEIETANLLVKKFKSPIKYRFLDCQSLTPCEDPVAITKMCRSNKVAVIGAATH